MRFIALVLAAAAAFASLPASASPANSAVPAKPSFAEEGRPPQSSELCAVILEHWGPVTSTCPVSSDRFR
ncbi:MAG: hypothetical protein RL513_267 [Pseudomonadota bacterium]